MTRCTGTDGCPVHPSVAVGPLDTPEAALVANVVAAAINATQIQPWEIRLGRDLLPVARRFLAALPPGFKITQLRAALIQIEADNVSPTLGWDDGDYRIRDRRVARAALAPAPSGRLILGIDSTMTDEEMADIAPLLPSSSSAPSEPHPFCADPLQRAHAPAVRFDQCDCTPEAVEEP